MISFTADRKALAEAISRASQGLPSRPSSPVLAGMLLRSGDPFLYLTAGDPGDMMFTSYTEADFTRRGSALVPGKMLSEVSRYFTGNRVRVECDGDVITITSGRSVFTLSGGDPELFPAFPEMPAAGLEIDAEAFSAAVRSVLPSVGKNTSVNALNTVCLSFAEGALFMIATDTTRMAAAALPAWADLPEVLVPPVIMERFSRTAEGTVAVGWNESLLSMTSPGLQVSSRLVSGKFMPWKKIMDKMPQEWITVSGPDLTRALKVAQLAAGDHDGVRLSFGGNELHVTAEGKAGARDTITADYPGEPVTLLFGAQKLLDGLQPAGGDIELGIAGNVMFLRSGASSFMVQSRRELKEEN